MAVVDELTIAVVGDVYVGESLRLLQDSRRAQVVRDWTCAGDVAIANLEMALTHRGHPADKVAVLRGDPALASEIAACGFSVVTMANNHMMDYGSVGLEDTLAAVDAVGLRRVGAGRDWDEATRPLRLQLPGGRLLHIINFACTLPPGSAAGPERPGVAPTRVTQQYQVDPIWVQAQPGTAPWVETFVQPQDERAACNLIAQAREEGGWVVVIMHWGLPPQWHAPIQGWLATYQRPLARRFIEAGASAIIGHHPRVLHGVETIDGCPVFYSLGVFMFHPWKEPTLLTEPGLSVPGYRLKWQQPLAESCRDPRKRESVFLHLKWRGEDWEAMLTPVCLDESGEPDRAVGAQAQSILERLQLMSAELGCNLEVDEGVARLAWST